ncbi:MAG: ferrous iron transport protein B [Clostridia bacterium]|jgi:ferrous iron transport protein B|nr:ferrous iron transport protein B [Clostridia bacterium]
MKLTELKPGCHARITEVGAEGALRQHLLDMGVIPQAVITMVKTAPMGDPIEYMIHGYELTLRGDDAAEITVEMVTDAEFEAEMSRRQLKENQTDLPHPGFGEGGKYHDREDEDPLPDGTVLTFALVGNQNCGKTTLFNQLTGSNRHVGNFPGVTVDRKDGAIIGHPEAVVTDLPGIYSMSPYSSEEILSRNFVLCEKPKAIINIVDSTNIERNMYLTMQLLEMDIPMVIALNMMDELTASGGSVDINGMEKMLGVPVVAISAAKNYGVHELIGHAIHVARYQEKPGRIDFCRSDEAGGALHRALHGIAHLIEDHARAAGIPVRFAAGKLIEGDPLVAEALRLDENEKDAVEHIIVQLERERGLDRNAAVADMRFSFIRDLCDATVTKPRVSREKIRSEKIDRILTGRFTAIPMFILIMGLTFFLSFNVIGLFLQNLLEKGIDLLGSAVDGWLTSAGVNETVHSLVTDGIFAGVGSVLSFLPIIVTMFFFLSMLEDSGYIARVAFVMDRLLRKLGLSGRSIVPMLIGFGCTVPAVMSTRTLPSERDRKMTILLIPFMSCSAKVPIYGFFVAAFFPKYSWLIMTGIYFLGILLGILAALLYKNTLFRGKAVPFVMELPNYRLPGPKNVGRLLWDKAKDFLQRAFTIILIATVVIWFLQRFDWRFNTVTDPKSSILASVSGLLVPLMRPAGLGDWRLCTSLICGFIAKESVVSTTEMLFEGGVASAVSSLSAASMLVFSLLYTPCVAAISSIRREIGSLRAGGVALWQCVVAWLAAVAVFQIGGLFL